MDAKLTELIAAVRDLLPYLEASDDHLTMGDQKLMSWIKDEATTSRANKLRREADAMEKKDSVIKRVRDAITKLDAWSD